MNTNFEKYFVKPKFQGFKKNFNKWKTECSDFQNYTKDESERDVYLFYHPETNLKCQYSDCKKSVRFDSLFKGFKETCCWKHSVALGNLRKYGVENVMHVDSTKEKLKQTNLEKYGVEHTFQNEKVKEKIKISNLERHGVENPMQSESLKKKLKLKMIEKYGVENISQSEEIKRKKEETCFKNHGVISPMHSSEVKEKMRENNLEKYGVEYPMQVDSVKEKIKRTSLERYGVEHILQVEEFREKGRKTCLERYGAEYPMQSLEIFKKFEKTTYTAKEFHWKTGEISIVQGYEDRILKELEEKGYSFNDIKTSAEEIPEFWYFHNGKKKRYFPDIFIPKENLIIEVKSTYTIKCDPEINNLKFQSVIDAGFNFKLEVR